MLPTIAECLEHARQCEWYAAHTSDGEDRKFLLRRAKHWTKLAGEKELEIEPSRELRHECRQGAENGTDCSNR